MSQVNPFENVPNPFGQAPILYTPRTASTMDDVRRLGNDTVSGTVLVAGHQTAGRGRKAGRVWQSEAHKNLLFTLMLARSAAPRSLETLPLRVGLAVCRFLESVDLSPRIKWPNDVLVNGRKICGVLCEARQEWVSIGVGLNCNQTVFLEETRGTATSMLSEGGSMVQLDAVLSELLGAIRDALSLDGWRKPLAERLHLVGQQITLRTGKPPIETNVMGLLSGIGPKGQLLLRTSGGTVEILSGEIVSDPLTDGR